MREVNLEFAYDKDRLVFALNNSDCMTQRHPYPGKKLIGTERFCDVVIHTDIQRRYFVAFLFFGGNNDNRGSCPFAQLTRYLQSIHIGQPQIQNNEIRMPHGSLPDPFLARSSFIYLITMGVECGPQETTNLMIVLNDKNQSTIIGTCVILLDHMSSFS